jgi:hypothetical protein
MNIKIGNKKYGAKGEYVGRPGILGNPFPMRGENEREEVCDSYESWFNGVLGTPEVESELNRLIDIYKRDGELTLVCYCAPKRCHALTIKNEIERRLQEVDFK